MSVDSRLETADRRLQTAGNQDTRKAGVWFMQYGTGAPETPYRRLVIGLVVVSALILISVGIGGLLLWRSFVRSSAGPTSRAYVEQGLAHAVRGDHREAIALHTGQCRAHYYLAIAYQKSGQRSQALQAYTKFIQVAPALQCEQELGDARQQVRKLQQAENRASP
jgi:hypothetical protein